jgi:hypothetical protein
MEAVRLCSARSESLRRTFLDRVRQDWRLALEVFSGPVRAITNR